MRVKTYTFRPPQWMADAFDGIAAQEEISVSQVIKTLCAFSLKKIGVEAPPEPDQAPPEPDQAQPEPLDLYHPRGRFED